MDISRMSQDEKAKFLGSLGLAVREVLGAENKYFLLCIDRSGSIVHLTDAPRDVIPRLLREYADALEKKR